MVNKTKRVLLGYVLPGQGVTTRALLLYGRMGRLNFQKIDAAQAEDRELWGMNDVDLNFGSKTMKPNPFRKGNDK